MLFPRLGTVKRIILSVGHGGLATEQFDPGAMQGKNSENQEAKQIVALLALQLAQLSIKTIILPDYGLSKTIQYLNNHYDAKTDWAIEIHKDSYQQFDKTSMLKRAGIYYHPNSLNSQAIAEKMVSVFIENGANKTSWSRPDTASNHKKLAWIRQPIMLSHIVECGFMEDDLSNISDAFYADMLAKAISGCLHNSEK